jgi:energy-converting hydrogenase Eha subunit C
MADGFITNISVITSPLYLDPTEISIQCNAICVYLMAVSIIQVKCVESAEN